jgi:hypothetical protein
MGAGAGLALKTLQWFFRGVEFCCAALVLAVYSYFLATLHSNNLDIGTWVRAVEGISGAGVLYTVLGLLLLCCLAGHPFTSFFAMVLDLCFVAAFIYVASANRGGAGGCTGTVNTVYGTGDANSAVGADSSGNGGVSGLPSLRQACQLETACMSVSIVAIFFFLFSAALELALVRHRRKEKRFGPGPANDYTSGYGRRGFFGFFRRRRNDTMGEDPNQLPQHTHPDEVRASYATEQTRVDSSAHEPLGTAYPKHGESGYERVNLGAADGVPTATYPPGNYRYEDGVFDARH